MNVDGDLAYNFLLQVVAINLMTQMSPSSLASFLEKRATLT
jgi:hypothetical protein